MNIYIQFGIYGLFLVLCLGLIASWLQKRQLFDTASISNLVFGFVLGGVGKLIYDEIMKEIYIEFPAVAIVCLSLLGLGVLGTVFNIVFIDKFALVSSEDKK